MTSEWMNNSNSNNQFIESYSTSNFQYINEDTCTSTTTTSSTTATTADEPAIPQSNDDTEIHAEILLNYFQQLYKSQKGIDLEIFCGGISVAKVHRIIIASFLRLLGPLIEEMNSSSSIIKLEIPNSIGVSIDDLREIINFLYTGKIVIKNKSILKSLDELGCNYILSLLYTVLEDDNSNEEEDGQNGLCETLVEDKYHAINLMKRLKECCDEKRFIDCSLRLENGAEVKCHRYCIAAFSDIVKDSLQQVENTQIVYLEISELESTSIKAVNDLITFIYSNKIPTDPKDHQKLKGIASIFGVDRLVSKLPNISAAPEIFESNEGYFDEESSTSFFEDSNSTSDAALDSNLTTENEYVNIYNQFVEGPTIPSCSDAYDPSVEYLTSSKPSKSFISKIPRYKCPLCEFASPYRGTIRKHIRSIHTQEAPYSCPHCFMAFKVQSNLVRHIRSHSQIKPYKCKSCGCEYADKKNMDAHIFREHLKKEPFQCPHGCVKGKFYREDSWRRHCQKLHSSLSNVTFPRELTGDKEEVGSSQNGSEAF